MKTSVKNAVLLIALVSVFSCSKNKIIDIIEDEVPDINNFYFKATINGTDYVANESELAAFTVVTDNDGITFAAFAEGFVDDSLSIIGGIKGFNGTGNYNMVDYEGSNLTYMEIDPSTGLNNVWLANSFTGSGVINVTQYGNGTASGTFSFTGVNPIDQSEATITNGEFHLILVE